MTVVLSHRETGERFVLLAPAFVGEHQPSASLSPFDSRKMAWVLDTVNDPVPQLIVTDVEGQVRWVRGVDVVVVSVDGRSPAQHLRDEAYR